MSLVELPLVRGAPDGDDVRIVRALADAVRYLGPAFREARWPRIRALRRLLKLAGHRKSKTVAARIPDDRLELPAEVCSRLGDALRELERAIPPDSELERRIAALEVDAVLLVTRLVLDGSGPDVLKVAGRLGLPSVALVWSWDNLSSKATMNEHPDVLLVWNALQVREAVSYHGIPEERVIALGAANFDRFFDDVAAAQPRPEGDPPTLLYLGSSPKIVPDEPPVFARWLEAVRASADERVRTARVVVRPHPASRRWEGWTPPEGVELSMPGAKIESATLADLLVRADAAVALNTSAEIEAAIAGTPVLTFRAGDEARGQSGSLHFHYLLEGRGGFTIDSRTLEGHVERLAGVLRGDHDPEPARRFVESFVRPLGLDRPVTPVLAETILRHASTPVPARAGRPLPADARRGGGRRILVLSPRLLVASMPDVFDELLGAGATLLFSGRNADRLGIPAGVAAYPNAATVPLPLARGLPEHDGERLRRALRDALRFLDESMADAAWARARAQRRFFKLAGHPEWKRAPDAYADVTLQHEIVARLDAALRVAGGSVAPPADLVEAVAELGADAVVLVSRCTLGGYEADVIRIARLLGIPSILLVWSWDNLSSKAVLHEHPDHLLVWNGVQAREAVELHGVEPGRIEIVGAPGFDRFFAEVGALEPPARSDRPTIVYAGSSNNVAPDEPDVFAAWLEALRGSADPALREAAVRVRPHPGEGRWRTWTPPDDPLVSVERWPRSERGRLAPLLAGADVVVALNTSAELEAAIAGRPVVTFRAGAGAPGQEGSLHFRYLLEENGGFVIDAAGLDEHLAVLSRVLAGGVDPGPGRAFVERFLRPRGIDRPVSPLVASAILELLAPAEHPVAELA
ncbi:MAG TPA: hypothetical protein VFB35_03120 [Gaiellaceae bacterium]|nr:hypothetical protein [Gaiellaceae bacterium]